MADFGLAKLLGAAAEPVAGAASNPATLTQAGKIMGTPNYMAPEQLDHPEAVDHRADIYSLGVVFYQMLTAQLPGRDLEPPSHKVQIDVRLDEVVLRALERNPERRYPQASAFKTQIEAIAASAAEPLSDRGQPTGADAALADSRTAMRKILLWHALLLLIVVALFIAASYLVERYATALAPGGQLPAATRLVCALAATVEGWWFVIIPALLGLDAALCWAARRLAGRRGLAFCSVAGVMVSLLAAVYAAIAALLPLEDALRQQRPEASSLGGAARNRADAAPPASEEQLLARFKSALENKDTNALMALVNWQGVPEPTRLPWLFPVQQFLAHLPAGAPVSVRCRPLPPDFETEMVRDGIRYLPNVELLGMVDYSFAVMNNGTNTGWSISMPYGTKGGSFYLAGTAGQKIYEPKTKDKVLTAQIDGVTFGPHTTTITGSCVYVQNGKELKKDFKGSTHILMFGDYIKSCIVQITSEDKQAPQLFINEDGKRVFESAKLDGKEPIVYEQPAQPPAANQKAGH